MPVHDLAGAPKSIARIGSVRTSVLEAIFLVYTIYSKERVKVFVIMSEQKWVDERLH